MSKFVDLGQLVQLSDNLYATRAAYYNKDYRDYTRKHLFYLSESIDFLISELTVPKNVKVIIKPINKQNTTALTIPKTGTIFLDPRRPSLLSMIIALCHEFAHLQQLTTKQLVWGDKKIIWENEKFEYSSLKEERDEIYYLCLPWELDARNKEKFYTKKIYDKVLNIKLREEFLDDPVNYLKIKKKKVLDI